MRQHLQFIVSLLLHGIISTIFTLLNIIGFLYAEILRHLNYKVTLDNTKHVIVITGCDSGFGELTSKRLASLGFQVVSGCISSEGAERLNGVVALSIVCDVTKEEDVQNLAKKTQELLDKNQFKLWGVINNAGIGNGGGIDWISTPTLKKVMDVNFYGVVMVTRAFLPMLKKTKNSRIANLSSIAGFLSAPTMGFYDASKHAVEGFAKALRAEMKLWNIHVSNLNPGFMRTPIVIGGKERTQVEFNTSALRDEYNDKVEDTTAIQKYLEDPELVVDALVDAMTDKYPPMWYFPGNQANFIFRHMTNLSSGAVDFLCLLTPSIARVPKPEVVSNYQQ